MMREGSGESQILSFRSNVDDVVAAGRAHPLGFEPGSQGGFTPFVVVRDGLRARLARPVYYELAALATERAKGGGPGVWSGGQFFPFPSEEGGG
jgi:hypothetical protein